MCEKNKDKLIWKDFNGLNTFHLTIFIYALQNYVHSESLSHQLCYPGKSRFYLYVNVERGENAHFNQPLLPSADN